MTQMFFYHKFIIIKSIKKIVIFKRMAIVIQIEMDINFRLKTYDIYAIFLNIFRFSKKNTTFMQYLRKI